VENGERELRELEKDRGKSYVLSFRKKEEENF
jgi:hypothetical protein